MLGSLVQDLNEVKESEPASRIEVVGEIWLLVSFRCCSADNGVKLRFRRGCNVDEVANEDRLSEGRDLGPWPKLGALLCTKRSSES